MYTERPDRKHIQKTMVQFTIIIQCIYVNLTTQNGNTLPSDDPE